MPPPGHAHTCTPWRPRDATEIPFPPAAVDPWQVGCGRAPADGKEGRRMAARTPSRDTAARIEAAVLELLESNLGLPVEQE